VRIIKGPEPKGKLPYIKESLVTNRNTTDHLRLLNSSPVRALSENPKWSIGAATWWGCRPTTSEILIRIFLTRYLQIQVIQINSYSVLFSIDLLDHLVGLGKIMKFLKLYHIIND